jgi:hypothetical protein
VLTILFLKYNWFEPQWRRDVLDVYLARGNHSFVPKILFTHLNQLPIALLDVTLLKQNHGGLFAQVTPPLSTLLCLCFGYSLCYLAFTHANHRLNKGIYPYPFLDKLLSKWSLEILFFVALSLFTFAICATFHFCAVEAAWIESKLFGA